MMPLVLLLFLFRVVAPARTPETWVMSNDDNYALFWKNLTVVRDSDGSTMVSEEVYHGDDEGDGEEDNGEEDSEDSAVFALLDGELQYHPYKSAVYFHFYRRDDHAFVDLKFDPCSDLKYYSDAWKEQGCNRTALTTTEELSTDEEVSAADDDEEGEGVTEIEGVEEDTPGTMFSDYFDENGNYVGPDFANNRVHPDGGGWRLSQTFVVDKKTNTMFRWENPASTLGVNHDLDFLFCESVKFTLTGEEDDTMTVSISFENVIFSGFWGLEWGSGDVQLNNYVGMRITSPCQANEICEAVNGNVACLAADETTSRKEYFANITTLEYVDGVGMEEPETIMAY